MSWIFSKAMMEHCESLHSSLGLEVASLVASCSDGEQYAQLNVIPTPHKFWRNDKTMEFSKLSQFGLTCKLLTEDLGGELLTLYLAGFHAKTLAQPVEVLESKESAADCGGSLRGLLAKYCPSTHSLKTAQCSLFEDSQQFCQTLPPWGTLQNGELYPLPMPYGLEEHRNWITSVIESGSLQRAPTPTVCGNYNVKGLSKTSGDGLATFVKRFPTPQASDNRDRGNMSDASIQRRIQIGKQIGLSTFVKEEAGPGSLSPDWTEWLMGWPIGWTDLKPLAMDKFQLWREQHLVYCQDDE